MLPLLNCFTLLAATEENKTVNNRGYFTSHDNTRETPQSNLPATNVTLPNADEFGKLGAEIRKVVGGSDADLGKTTYSILLMYIPMFTFTQTLSTNCLIDGRTVS